MWNDVHSGAVRHLDWTALVVPQGIDPLLMRSAKEQPVEVAL